MKPFAIILFTFVLLACSNKPAEFRRTKNLSEITGTRFVLPANPKWIILDRDTIVQIKNEPRLIVYLDGSACTPCALTELRHWKPIIKQVEEQILFILQTNTDNEAVKKALIEQQFDFPIMCDVENNFARYNLLPQNDLFHVFLLDETNKVFQVGNPLISIKMYDVFKKHLKILNDMQSKTIN